jgi:hypothetical protein
MFEIWDDAAAGSRVSGNKRSSNNIKAIATIALAMPQYFF